MNRGDCQDAWGEIVNNPTERIGEQEQEHSHLGVFFGRLAQLAVMIAVTLLVIALTAKLAITLWEWVV